MSDQYPVVAFLQNAWFPVGTSQRHLDLYRTSIEFRRRVLAQSATGKRLIRAFGEDIYSKIWWDNANPREGTFRRAMHDPDTDHINKVLVQIQPKVVVALGKMAQGGIATLMQANGEPPFEYLSCPHPGAFDVATPIVLRDLAIKVCESVGWPAPPPLVNNKPSLITE